MSRNGTISLVAAMLLAAFLICYSIHETQTTERTYIKAGYTRTTLPGSGCSEWVKP